MIFTFVILVFGRVVDVEIVGLFGHFVEVLQLGQIRSSLPRFIVSPAKQHMFNFSRHVVKKINTCFILTSRR